MNESAVPLVDVPVASVARSEPARVRFHEESGRLELGLPPIDPLCGSTEAHLEQLLDDVGDALGIQGTLAVRVHLSGSGATRQRVQRLLRYISQDCDRAIQGVVLSPEARDALLLEAVGRAFTVDEPAPVRSTPPPVRPLHVVEPPAPSADAHASLPPAAAEPPVLAEPPAADPPADVAEAEVAEAEVAEDEVAEAVAAEGDLDDAGVAAAVVAEGDLDEAVVAAADVAGVDSSESTSPASDGAEPDGTGCSVAPTEEAPTVHVAPAADGADPGDPSALPTVDPDLPTDLTIPDSFLPDGGPLRTTLLAQDAGAEDSHSRPWGQSPDSDRRVLALRRTVRSGRIVRFAGDVVVFGDVNDGAQIVADGDIVVLGRLRGLAHAGRRGDPHAIVVGLDMQSGQVRIGDTIAFPRPAAERAGTSRLAALLRRAPPSPHHSVSPSVARVVDGEIRIEDYRGRLHA